MGFRPLFRSRKHAEGVMRSAFIRSRGRAARDDRGLALAEAFGARALTAPRSIRFRLATAMSVMAVFGMTEPAPGRAQSVKPTGRTAARVNELLNLDASRVVTLDLSGGVAGSAIAVEVPIDDTTYTLRLEPHSVRSRDYRLLAQVADGSLVDVEQGAIKTLRGSIEGHDGSVVAASLVDGELRAMILLPDGSRYWIEPVGSRLAGAAGGEHVVYHETDVRPTNRTCAVWTPPGAPKLDFSRPDGGVAAKGPLIAELAIDADYEYFSDFSTLSEMEDQINLIINTVNAQYERDVGITHVITTIIARTVEDDPYSTTDPGIFLSQFKDEWDTIQRNVPRDLAQLFTGKNLDRSTIGVAWWGGTPGIDTVCGEFGYSIVESNCSLGCANLASKTDLSAHELGHNWVADHCNCSGWTMNPSITAANRFHATLSIPEIMNYRDTRTCLDEGDVFRRVIVSADASVVYEGDALQFAATANFRFAGNQDVTMAADWSVDPPTAGSIDANGLFTPVDVDFNACVTVIASYTLDTVKRADNLTVTVIDVDAPLRIVQAQPPDGAVDARQPIDPATGWPLGWTTLEITLAGDLCSVAPADFFVDQQGGMNEAPTVFRVEQFTSTTFLVTLSRPIEPGAWTVVTHVGSGLTTRIGFLPGDVNGDGTSDGADILTLMDALYGVGDPPPIWSADLDRSGRAVPPDLLELIDLLEGTSSSPGWRGVSLP